MKTVAILLAALLICQTIPNLPVVGSSDAIAQERPMTPTLLKRLAEAVDGNRTGEPIWVIAEYDFPNRILGVRPARTPALNDSVTAWTAASGRLTGMFGPFVASKDTLTTVLSVSPLAIDADELQPVRPLEGCQHDGSGSMMDEAICPPEMIRLDRIHALHLVYETITGDTIRVPIPLTTDAIFFTVPAIDKFVLPYYARTLGVEEAARMRIRMLGRFVGH